MNEGVSKSFRTGTLERELQMVQLSATRCSCIAILWVSLVSFVSIILCVASQRVFIIVVYFVIDSVRKLLGTPSYATSDLYHFATPQGEKFLLQELFTLLNNCGTSCTKNGGARELLRKLHK
jgi:hypothetical protein